MHEAATMKPQVPAPAKNGPTLPTLLNEGQVADLLGVSRRKVHALRQEDWFPPAIEFGPRALRWHRDELLVAIAGRAPRVTKLEEPQQLAEARAGRRVYRTGNLAKTSPRQRDEEESAPARVPRSASKATGGA